jgi:TRAP-type C4-dicarboxylate transport system permease small subunit
MDAQGVAERHKLPIWLTRIDRLSGAIGLVMGIFGGALFFVASIYIVIDVLGRNFGGPYSGATDEMSGYALAVGTSWAMAFTLRKQSHIIVDYLVLKASVYWQAVLSALGMASMAIFGAAVAWFTWRLAAFSLAIDARSDVAGMQLWIPQALMAFGFLILTIDAIVLILVDIFKITSRRKDLAVTRLV